MNTELLVFTLRDICTHPHATPQKLKKVGKPKRLKKERTNYSQRNDESCLQH